MLPALWRQEEAVVSPQNQTLQGVEAAEDTVQSFGRKAEEAVVEEVVVGLTLKEVGEVGWNRGPVGEVPTESWEVPEWVVGVGGQLPCSIWVVHRVADVGRVVEGQLGDVQVVGGGDRIDSAVGVGDVSDPAFLALPSQPLALLGLQ